MNRDFESTATPRTTPRGRKVKSVTATLRRPPRAPVATDRARGWQERVELRIRGQPAVGIHLDAAIVGRERGEGGRPPWVQEFRRDALGIRQVPQGAEDVLLETRWPCVRNEEHRERERLVMVVRVLLAGCVEQLL